MNSVPLQDGGPATRGVSAVPGGAEVTLRPTESTSGSPGFVLVGGLIGLTIGTFMAIAVSRHVVAFILPITFLEFLTRLSRPEAFLELCFYAVIVLWVVVWNLGSGAALVTALRLSFGLDVFRLSREEWWVRRGIGRVGRKRVLRGRDVRVFLHKGDYGLFARKGEELIFLTDFGSVNDRRWLRDELRSRFGIPASSTSEEGLPTAWSSLQLSDGALQLRESRASGRAKIGCVGIPAALWSFGLFLASRGLDHGLGGAHSKTAHSKFSSVKAPILNRKIRLAAFSWFAPQTVRR